MTRFIALTIFTLIAISPVFAQTATPAMDDAPNVTQTVQAELPIETPTAPDQELGEGPFSIADLDEQHTITNGCICHTQCSFGQCFQHCTCT